MKFKKRVRTGYFFGYGADQEQDMIRAITGSVPEVIGRASLPGWELRIQALSEITAKGQDPHALLKKTWGNGFESYVIVPKKQGVVEGVLFRLSVHDRHLIDQWELVQMGWYKRAFVKVTVKNGQHFIAETQVLSAGQTAKKKIVGRFTPWLMSKRRLIKIAKADKERSGHD